MHRVPRRPLSWDKNKQQSGDALEAGRPIDEYPADARAQIDPVLRLAAAQVKSARQPPVRDVAEDWVRQREAGGRPRDLA
jgi:hypothetical protein